MRRQHRNEREKKKRTKCNSDNNNAERMKWRPRRHGKMHPQNWRRASEKRHIRMKNKKNIQNETCNSNQRPRIMYPKPISWRRSNEKDKKINRTSKWRRSFCRRIETLEIATWGPFCALPLSLTLFPIVIFTMILCGPFVRMKQCIDISRSPRRCCKPMRKM